MCSYVSYKTEFRVYEPHWLQWEDALRVPTVKQTFVQTVDTVEHPLLG